jgi:hypothetical protein
MGMSFRRLPFGCIYLPVLICCLSATGKLASFRWSGGFCSSWRFRYYQQFSWSSLRWSDPVSSQVGECMQIFAAVALLVFCHSNSPRRSLNLHRKGENVLTEHGHGGEAESSSPLPSTNAVIAYTSNCNILSSKYMQITLHRYSVVSGNFKRLFNQISTCFDYFSVTPSSASKVEFFLIFCKGD